MQIQTELSHIQDQRVIVKVSIWKGDKCLGSTLSESKTVEEAENKGIERLIYRLETGQYSIGSNKITTTTNNYYPERNSANMISKDMIIKPSGNSNKNIPYNRLALNTNHKNTNNSLEDTHLQSPKKDLNPIDWSDDLTSIDSELTRIKWDREAENRYLQRALGCSNRNKITAYEELTAYLSTLRLISAGQHPDEAVIPESRKKLIDICNTTLRQLNWDSNQAKAYLQQIMQVNGRNQLNNSQLNEFNQMLAKKIEENT